MKRARHAALAAALALAVAVPACGGDQSLVLVGGAKIDDDRIDRDPLALLPSGVILVGYLDAQALFASPWGPDVGTIISNLLPLGPESNFVAKRDVTRVVGGVYAMQGADFCAVVQGSFDTTAIRRAADTRAITALGAPLVKNSYAGNDLYTAGNLGFALLTSHTVLTGNETGMRRALDRLRMGKLERSIRPWMVELFATKNATMAFAGDLGTDAAARSAIAQQAPFLNGARAVRVIGNFEPPGANFAGALTFGDPQTAITGAAALRNAQQIASVVSIFASLGGFPFPSLQIAHKESDVAFTTQVDDRLVRSLLGVAVDTTRRASSVAPIMGPR